jgi:hypothetical protein
MGGMDMRQVRKRCKSSLFGKTKMKERRKTNKQNKHEVPGLEVRKRQKKKAFLESHTRNRNQKGSKSEGFPARKGGNGISRLTNGSNS